MEVLLKDDEFAQHLFTVYFKDQNPTIEEMLNLITSSIAEFANALDCWQLNSGAVSKH